MLGDAADQVRAEESDGEAGVTAGRDASRPEGAMP